MCARTRSGTLTRSGTTAVTTICVLAAACLLRVSFYVAASGPAPLAAAGPDEPQPAM